MYLFGRDGTFLYRMPILWTDYRVYRCGLPTFCKLAYLSMRTQLIEIQLVFFGQDFVSRTIVKLQMNR